jgi:hypothetical protein
MPDPETLSEVDQDAARRALARNWPELKPETVKYNAFFEALAGFHRLFGTKKFELRYNLRPPTNRTEEWTQQFMHGQIDEVGLRERLKQDAERPIDLEMLTTFHDAYQENLEHYSGVLQHAVSRPSEQDSATWKDHEKAIESHVAALRGKLPLWRENLETVFEFLEVRRITSGAALLQLGDFEGTSAHWLAQLAFKRMTEAWQSCTEVAARSQRDRRYTYPARTIDLFASTWLKQFPPPQKISERLREEFILARVALPVGSPAGAAVARDTSPTTAQASVERSIDNESRELVLLGEFQALVANAGHIFRPTSNSDWGIDGEIEFKDAQNRASGQRLYVQLKSGDSYLLRRQRDDEEIFTVKTERHLEYWRQHAYPVMLVIRSSSGTIRWMNVTKYLVDCVIASNQIVFRGEEVTPQAIEVLAQGPAQPPA